MFKRKSRFKIEPTKPHPSSGENGVSVVKAEEIEEQSEVKALVRDSQKRQRLIFLAILNSASIIIAKMWATWEWTFTNTVIFAGVLAVCDYLLMIFCFRLKVKKETFYTVLPQPTLFVFSSVLMLELIFFQRFERIFEGVVFTIVLVLFTAALSGVFLSSNIMNVSLFKSIPLLQVAQTISFVVTLLIFYFSTFSFISGGLYQGFLFLILFLIYSVSVFSHLSHFSINLRIVGWYSVAIGWGAMSVLFSLLMWPVGAFLASLVPMMVAYVGCGVVMHSSRKSLTSRVIFEYLALFFVILFVVIFQAKWGIGGAFWKI